MDKEHIAAIEKIILTLRSTRKLTKRELDQLSREHLSQMLRRAEAGSRAKLVLDAQPESYLFAEGGGGVKAVDNDPVALIEIIQSGIEAYISTGLYPAPYYPWRIAILLRKAKRPDIEARFLRAFSAKFADGVGKKYKELVNRADKAQRLADKL